MSTPTITSQEVDKLISLKGIAFWKAFFDATKTMRNDSMVRHTARMRANFWEQCACCELKAERKSLNNTYSYPRNAELEELGTRFNTEIKFDQYTTAKRIFDEIQTIVAIENAL